LKERETLPLPLPCMKPLIAFVKAVLTHPMWLLLKLRVIVFNHNI
jgi:hypothetical protein